jgi:hypothetical protein
MRGRRVYNEKGVSVDPRDGAGDAMPDQRDAPHLLEMAEHAAIAGDFSSAEEFLTEAARIQEAELGPFHPDLANTVTNLAIVAEKSGRTSEAGTFYQRAADIAEAALPQDHPAVIESRKNLEDFCREHHLPIVGPVVRRGTSHDAPLQLLLAFAAVALIAVAFLLWRPWSPDQASAVAPDRPPTREPAQPPDVMPPPAAPSPSSKAAASADDRGGAPSNPSSSAGGVSLVIAQVCQPFSTSGDRWQCDPVGGAAEPGRLALYTRVKSSNDATIVHRWYQGDTLRQAVRLRIGANTAEGYRTYSRQTVNGTGDWRVEVSSASGALLHEERFSVR